MERKNTKSRAGSDDFNFKDLSLVLTDTFAGFIHNRRGKRLISLYIRVFDVIMYVKKN